MNHELSNEQSVENGGHGDVSHPGIEDWEEIHRAFKTGNINPEQAARWSERGFNFIHLPEVKELYFRFWLKIDGLLAPARMVWNNNTLYPPLLKKCLYKLNPLVRQLVDVGIFDLPEGETEASLEEQRAGEMKIEKLALRIASLVEPEIRPFMPLFEVVMKSQNYFAVLNRELRTYIAEHRVENEGGDLPQEHLSHGDLPHGDLPQEHLDVLADDGDVEQYDAAA